MNEVQTKLRAAQDLIRDPERWCKNALARAADGCVVSETADEATQWCAVGACYRVTNNEGWRIIDPLIEAAREAGYANAADLNNESGHEATLAMFDRAIELAGEG